MAISNNVKNSIQKDLTERITHTEIKLSRDKKLLDLVNSEAFNDAKYVVNITDSSTPTLKSVQYTSDGDLKDAMYFAEEEFIKKNREISKISTYSVHILVNEQVLSLPIKKYSSHIGIFEKTHSRQFGDDKKPSYDK